MTTPSIDTNTAKQWLENDDAILIDVREPAEHHAENIQGAVLHPLSTICYSTLPETNKKIIIHCQKGMRGSSACQKLLAENDALDIYNLEGGIMAWKEAGMPTQKGSKKLLPLDRQVQLTIGISVLASSLLAIFYHPSFSLVSAFFGAGLTFAGLTGFCGLARLMAKMPWNQQSER